MLVAPSPYCRITYARQSTAPSIPIPGKSYGYEETDTGGLVPQAPPDRDSTIGPAFYNIYHVRLIVAKPSDGPLYAITIVIE